jgi:uracil-DNA glycosylase family 4
VKPVQRRVLAALPATRAELVASMGLKQTTVTSALKALARAGYAAWQDGMDGAPARWVLTAEGQAERMAQGPKHAWLVGAECGDCPLRAGCAAVPPTLPDEVPAVGTWGRVLIVGEAPATQEVREGRPFVGNTGKLLTDLLRQVGVDRRDVGLTNSVACQLPHGDDGESKGPPHAALRACRMRLAVEVARWNPGLIVALGKAAVRTLTGRTGLERLHGLILPGEGPFEGRRVLCTYHPAALFRNQRLLHTLRSDLSRILSAPQVQVAEHFEIEVVERPVLPPGVAVAVDIETDGLRVGAPIPSVAFAHEPHRAQVVLNPTPATFAGLDCGHNRWVYHNGMFDVPRLRHAPLWPEARCDEDTQLLAHALDERGDHRLEYLATVLLGAAEWKAEARGASGAGKYQPAGLSPEALAHLNGVDACHTWRLLGVLREQVEREGTMGAYRVMMGAMEPLLDMQRNGMLLDLEALRQADARLSAELEEAHAQFRILADALGADIPEWANSRSRHNYHAPLAMRHLLDGLGLLGRKKSTGARVLAGIVAKGQEPGKTLVELLLRCRHLHKLIGNYGRKLPALAGPDGRIRTVYKLHGTATGRLSSGDKELGAPNLQNIAGYFKSAIIAPPGRKIVNVDLSQAEIRTLAHFAQDPALNAMLAQGVDTHRAIASIAFGIPVEGVSDKQRKQGKTLNFGILYGRGEAALAAELGCSLLEARGLIEQYYRRLPRVAEWKRETEEQALRDGYVTYSLGYRRHFAGLKEDEVRREAVNSKIQGTAGHIPLVALAEMWPVLKGNQDVLLIGEVHDSIVLEVREDLAVAVGEYVRSTLVDVPRRVFGMEVPFKADVEIGQRWGVPD